jgi:hypothetical protein
MTENSLQYRPPFAPLPPVSLEESRERAVKLLSDGYAYDRLTESEFEWRLGRLGSTESPAAVDALVADLLGPAPSYSPAPSTLGAFHRRIMAVMSNSRHAGPWTVPPQLDVAAVMSEVRIDLRHATIPAACTIDVSAFMANVSIIVPPGMPVHFDVSAIMATSRNDAVPTSYQTPGVPLITVKGFAFMAEVRVRVRELGR